ncbi:MAG: manganese transport system membrane protein MntD [Chitinophagales bacterium]|nr:MAG: manganese transport system membrane protein MntD [Chitinophagales bacterium]
MSAFWIILTGSLVAVTCSLLGCFLVLRKMSMMGDAISHAVLPGIVLAYLVTGSGASLPVLTGAAGMGLLAAYLIEAFQKKGKLQTDASIGLTFTSLFACGVILISLFARNIHLDADCVLYGEIAYVPLDSLVIGGTYLGPRAVWLLGALLVGVVSVIVAGYRGLLLTTFDPAYAVTLGVSATFWHYLLVSMVSLACVISFESVGAILVVAMLIVPASAAYLLTSRLSHMLILASLLGILGAFGGYYLAFWLDASIAGAMTSVMGLEFLMALMLVTLKRPSGNAVHVQNNNPVPEKS